MLASFPEREAGLFVFGGKKTSEGSCLFAKVPSNTSVLVAQLESKSVALRGKRFL
jgi:hypothetical protein